MTRVVVVQELLAQYRVPFFDGLRTTLAQQGIQLDLVHGRASGDRAARNDEASLPSATVVDNRRVGAAGVELVWQPVLRQVRGADLVIVEAANRMLVNYVLLVAASIGGPRVALWGHGGNLQGDASSGRERLKRRVARLPHWWFAYTGGSAERVAATGFPAERITVVQNSVDTSAYERVGEVSKARYGAVYVGGLDRTKRLDFLIEASTHVADTLPGFTLDVVGDGPDIGVVRRAAETRPWLTVHGPLFGAEKARVVSSASVLLMPGLVGLVAVDSFAARTPMMAIGAPTHSPEAEYLVDGANAVVLPRDTVAAGYAAAVASLLTDSDRLDRLRRGCAEAAGQYSLAQMVDRFAAGTVAAVGGAGARRRGSSSLAATQSST